MGNQPLYGLRGGSISSDDGWGCEALPPWGPWGFNSPRLWMGVLCVTP